MAETTKKDTNGVKFDFNKASDCMMEMERIEPLLNDNIDNMNTIYKEKIKSSIDDETRVSMDRNMQKLSEVIGEMASNFKTICNEFRTIERRYFQKQTEISQLSHIDDNNSGIKNLNL